MQAMALEKPLLIEEEPLKLKEIAKPAPAEDEVLIKVSICGVCHTDLHTVEGELSPLFLPIIPGHQVVGTIEEMGQKAKAKGWEIGQKVGVAWLYASCGKCEFCRRGEENLCQNALFTGLSKNGGYAEYMVADADFIFALPEGYEDTKLAPLLCAGIIGYRSLRLAEVTPQAKVGLFGFGASAHLALQLCRFWDCEVLVFTRSKKHQDLARKLGAFWVGSPYDTPPVSLDCAVSFAPAGSIIPLALKALRPGGTLAINAIYLDEVPQFSYELLYGERTLRSVTNLTRKDGVEFLSLASQIPLEVATEVFKLEKANEALLKLKKGEINGAAVLKIA
jgi:propanol-preferring alcohol dehydrogenase